MKTTVNGNVSTTTYKWVWQDDPEAGWDKVTNFHPDVMGPDGKMIGLHLNPNGPKTMLQKILDQHVYGIFAYQDDYHVKGYEFTANFADRADYSAKGSVDMMRNQAFDIGLTFPLGGLGRLSAEGAVFRFSQKTASPMFSEEGAFAGKSIGGLHRTCAAG